MKQTELAQQSGLQLNLDLKSQTRWDETEIDGRARRLAQAACRVWIEF